MTSTSLAFAATSLLLAVALIRVGTAGGPASAMAPTDDTTTAASGAPAPSALEPLPDPASWPPLPTVPRAGTPAAGDVPPSPTVPPATVAATEDGFLVVTGDGAAVGEGRLTTFTVEVEPATGADPTAVVGIVEAALFAPQRGWAADPRHRLQRVSEPARADVRVVLASPETVDRLCGRVGLRTNGHLSCWDGRRALLNHRRWLEGAAAYGADLAAYRTYLVSHEFGHGLGHGHRGCPGPGLPAPVMMQQTKGVGACAPNPWPLPTAAP